jgi:hypothetical protein
LVLGLEPEVVDGDGGSANDGGNDQGSGQEGGIHLNQAGGEVDEKGSRFIADQRKVAIKVLGGRGGKARGQNKGTILESLHPLLYWFSTVNRRFRCFRIEFFILLSEKQKLTKFKPSSIQNAQSEVKLTFSNQINFVLV